MKNRGRLINLIGILFGIISLGIILFSVFYLIHTKPFFGRMRYDFGAWEKIEEEKRVDGVFDSLEVKNFSGSVKIKSWDKDYTHVQYSKWGPSADRIEVKIKKNGGGLSLQPGYLSGTRKSFGSVSFDINIPESVNSIYAESVGGSIKLSNMSSGINQRLKTVSGSIETDNSKDLTATSISGSIKFRFSGSRLYAKTVSGRIRGDVLDIFQQGSVDLSSVSGSIHINAYSNFSADVTLKSVSGSVSCEFPILVQSQKKNHLEGRIGEGAATVRINTTSGSIRIGKL